MEKEKEKLKNERKRGIEGPKIEGPGLDIHGPKFDAGLDIYEPKIDLLNVDVDINAPKIRGGLDIHKPKIGLEVNASKIVGDIRGKKDEKKEKEEEEKKNEEKREKEQGKKEDEEKNLKYKKIENESIFINKYNEYQKIRNDNNYKNFDVKDIKKLFYLTRERDILYTSYSIALKDGRIILIEADDTNKEHILSVYNINNNKSDICLKYEDDSTNIKLILMNDGNIIFEPNYRYVRIIIIKDKDIEIFQTNIEKNGRHVYEIPNTDNIILFGVSNRLSFYTHSNNKLELYKEHYIDIIKGWDQNIEEICFFNENEIGISLSKKGTFYGFNDFFYFYDIKSKSITKKIKIGDHNAQYLHYLNENNILLQHGNNHLQIYKKKNYN